MKEHDPAPLIVVPACVKDIDNQPFHTVGDKYVRAIAVSARGLPVMLPSLEELIDLPELVSRLDGFMLTGSPSNVHPDRYGQPATPEAEPYDQRRDATILPLIEEILAQDVPLLAICRGFQELNVALGGTLHARVHELPDRLDHRRPQHEDPDVQYGDNHMVHFTPGGAFAEIAGGTDLMINSLHWQALDRVAERLEIEGTAPDGTIEAVRVKDAKGFALGVQWHPEYKSWENPFSTKLFSAFGEAARQHALRRTGRSELLTAVSA